MNTTSRAGWLVLAFLCAANWLLAQTSTTEDLQRADKQFDLYAYNLALKTYSQVLEKDPNNAHALARVADCYFQLNKPEESLSWYARAVQLRRPDSDVQMRYGKALMMKGDYALAKRQFLEYAAMNNETQEPGRHYADMCDYAEKTAKQAPLFVVRNEPLNTAAADFGPSFLINRVVYSSARTDIVRKAQSQSASDWSGSAYNQLFITQRNPENNYLQKPTFLRNDLQNTYNEGPVSYSADGKRVAFCRNNFINGTRQIAEKGVNMSLYTADVVNGEWVNVKAFPYNGSDYATGFPSLSPNGTTLIFASNNPSSTTGGKGWDLYVSNLVNGEWSTPRNLGAPLNSPGNEVTPYYDGKDLYFSSDWHSGLGGLDVFRAELGKDAISNIYHLGPGINSSFDDYGFIYNTEQNIGYMTSNRPGGRGNEDIWQVINQNTAAIIAPLNTTPPRSIAAAESALSPQTYSTTNDFSIKNYVLYVYDNYGKPLPGVLVDFSECNRERGQTDLDGKYYFSALTKPVDCVIELSKSGYETTRVDVREFGAHNISVAVGIDKRQEFVGRVVDSRTRQPLYGAIVEFKDAGKIIQTSTDVNGQYALMLTPLNTYDIEYSSDGYKVAKLKMRPGTVANNYTLDDVLLEQAFTGSYSSRSTTSQPNNLIADAAPAQYGITTVPSTSKPTTTLIPVQQPDPLPEFNGYSIQLAATPESLTGANTQKYESLATHGNLYAKSEDNLNKVRLGIYPTKEEAVSKLKEVNKDSRYKGAFIVEERGADKSLVIGGAAAPVAAAPAQYSTNTAKSVPASTATTNSDIIYAVQLGSFSPDNPISISDYASLSDVGNVYSKSKNGSLKMRLGVWPNYADAEAAQAEAVKRGFSDAIIVTEKSSDESLKPFVVAPIAAPATYSTPVEPTASRSKWENKGAATTTTTASTQTSGTKYYIRLCALSDPARFDGGVLEGAGVDGSIEKWPIKNSSMTAIMLGAYTTSAGAESDWAKVRNNGFPDAYIVKQQDGDVSRIK
ncbi:MAG: carboxypeptidase regulatory-like domain-containing protein [Saprospiraceae bacterium]